jgi:hypothetical protein
MEHFFSIDLTALTKTTEEKKITGAQVSFPASSIFTFGETQIVVSTQEQSCTPEIISIDLLKDGLSNLYAQLNWRVDKAQGDVADILGFNVYRRKVRPEEAEKLIDITTFDKNAFDKLSVKNQKTGKFSEEKKAIFNTKRSMLSSQTLNPNVTTKTQVFDNNLDDYEFHEIQFIDYSSYMLAQRQKQVFSEDRRFATISATDRSINYGDVYQYFVETVTKVLKRSPQSDIVTVAIEDLSPVQTPIEVFIGQLNSTTLSIQVVLSDDFTAWRLLVARKEEDIGNYHFIPDVDINSSSVVFTDAVQPGKQYQYRIFVKNIFGRVSSPIEISHFVTEGTKKPFAKELHKPSVLSAVKDNNSFNVLINIFPNNPSVLYYALTRKDITTKEKDFKIPSKDFTGYGGTGWSTNQFFVERQLTITNSDPTAFAGNYSLKNIQFIDDTVERNHIYQYRVTGYDVAGNPTSSAFAYASVSDRNNIRPPINLRIEVIREYPLRIRLSWTNDNAAQNIKTKYRVERRTGKDRVFQAFPLTDNTFLIDEMVSLDAISFDGNQFIDNPDSLGETPVAQQLESELTNFRRSFAMPDFIQPDFFYYYRVIAVSDTLESNSSDEIKYYSRTPLSNQINFVATLVNAKVRPYVVRLSWENERNKLTPDHFVIERKIDTTNDVFRVIQRVYLENEFLDYDVKGDNRYVYRIKAFDNSGRSTEYQETRVVVG